MFGRIDPWMLHKRYMITLKNGETFAGILELRTKHSVVIQQASQWNTAGELFKLDGRIIIERTQILYYQEMSPPNAPE